MAETEKSDSESYYFAIGTDMKADKSADIKKSARWTWT